MTRSPRGLLERCITEFDAALRSVVEPQASGRPRPGPDATPAGDDVLLSDTERDLSARLMRVNHSGEIAAQALYRGQALVARDDALRERLLAAAREERDHLEWCAARTRELGGRVSVLAPFWYAGAATIGALAGLLGDRASLGFLAETEKQVAEHLDGHLGRLPARDLRTRDIVATMRAEELAHRSDALARGGMDVPLPGRLAMRLASRVMTTVAHWL